MKDDRKYYGINFGWKFNAGIISVGIGHYSIHIGVQKSHWLWGHEEGWFDGRTDCWGLGPLILITWLE